MKKYNTVIFDLDGTLLDTLEDLTDAVNHALVTCGMKKRTMDEIRQFVGNGIRNLMIRAVEGGEANPLFEQVFAEFQRYYKVHCNDKTKPYPEVLKMLADLKEKGYHLGIVSNKADYAVKELRQLYFTDYVDTAIGEREGVARKPAGDMVLLALEEMEAMRSQAIYVGDSDVDIKTAHNSGIPCISVTWGFRDEAFLLQQGARYLADTADEVIAHIERENEEGEV